VALQLSGVALLQASETKIIQPLAVQEFLSLSEDMQAVYVGGVLEGMSYVQYGYGIPDLEKWTECVRRKSLGETAAEVASVLKSKTFNEGVSSALAQTMGLRCKHWTKEGNLVCGESSKDALDIFVDRVKRGICVEEFLSCYDELFSFVHSSGLTADYRAARGRLKCLRDEITPAVRFIRLHAAPGDQVQFSMSSEVPDCIISHREPRWDRTVEITVAQARERFHLMTELNETGTGRAFTGLVDDNSTSEFLSVMNGERQVYSTTEAQSVITRAILRCAERKAHSEAHTLLIEGPLRLLPHVRWQEIVPQLRQLVQVLRFSEVYLVGDHDDDSLCLRLK
jgi:hypothetical protein